MPRHGSLQSSLAPSVHINLRLSYAASLPANMIEPWLSSMLELVAVRMFAAPDSGPINAVSEPLWESIGPCFKQNKTESRPY